MPERTTEKDALARRLAGVLKTHAECGAESTVEVHADRTGTLHYPCGATITEVRGLADADRRHLAEALAAEALDHVYPPGVPRGSDD